MTGLSGANRTKLGLKMRHHEGGRRAQGSANRTKLGLKERMHQIRRVSTSVGANRTKLGLKDVSAPRGQIELVRSIPPQYNGQEGNGP